MGDEGRQQDLIIAGQGHELPQQPKLQETETQGPVQGTEIIDGGGDGMNKSDSRAAQEVAVVVDESRQQDLIVAGQGHEVPQQPKLPETETELIYGGGEGLNKSEQDSVHGGDDEVWRTEWIAIKAQHQDTETQGPVQGTATIEKAVKDTKSQCRGLLVSSRMWYWPVRVRSLSNGLMRPRQWVRKGVPNVIQFKV